MEGSKKIISITGLMGVGKTTIGAKLAEKLGYYFIDCDQEIEDRAGQTIAEIFAKKGEKYFRQLEKEMIKEIVSRDENIVLSLGGGGFIEEENRKILKEKTTTIWLYASIDVILRRIEKKNTRPLLNKTNKRKTLDDLAKKRYSLYSEADLKFDTGQESYDAIISDILKQLRSIKEREILGTIEKKVTVDLGERSYDILIGNRALNSLTEFLSKKSYSKIFVITDNNVANLHLSTLKKTLESKDIVIETIIIKSGEQSKSFAILEKVSEEILAKGIDRKSLILAFGGGVVGDLAGFIASILLRGIDFVQIPTSLLAMVDSSVGGKTAINSKHGKNLIGSFYQPKLVICDLRFLQTLPKRELKSGYAEVVKYGFIQDRSFFEFLEKNCSKIFASSTGYDDLLLAEIITKSCEIKAEIVGNDEKESAGGKRILLNFGHTFGHIFETETNYSSELLHGEAVAIGMVMAAKMSLNFGMITQDDFRRIKSHIENVGLITSPINIRNKWNESNLTSHLTKDKKNEGNSLTFILLEAFGQAIVKRNVALDEFKKILQEFLIAN